MSERGELVDSAGYEGFCLGIDLMLQALGLNELPDNFIPVLTAANHGRRHAPRRDLLVTAYQRRGYNQFCRHIARRAMLNIATSLEREARVLGEQA